MGAGGWRDAYQMLQWAAQLQGAGAIPGWDSPLGLLTPWLCPLPACLPALPSAGVPAFIYCAKDSALFTLQGASSPRQEGCCWLCCSPLLLLGQPWADLGQD